MEHTAKAEKHEAAPAAHAAKAAEPEAPAKARHSSKGTRRLTDIDKRVSKAVRRVTRALDNGVDSYMEHRDKSRLARRDGVIVDFVENVSHGVSRAVSDASPVIHDVAEAFNTRAFRSNIRRFARTFGSIPFIG